MSNVKICSKFREFLHTLCCKICIFLLACMLIIITLQVALRNVFEIPMPWAEALSVYMMISLALYGSVFVLHEKGHLCVEALVQRFSIQMQMIVRVFLLLVQAVFVITVVWFSIGSVSHASKVDAVSLGVSMFFPYLVLPVAFFLIFLETIFQLIDTTSTLWGPSKGGTV